MITRSTPNCCYAQVQSRREGAGLRVPRSSLMPPTRPHRDSSDNPVAALNAAESGGTKKPVLSDVPVVETAPPQWPIAIRPNSNSLQLLHSILLVLETPEHLQYNKETFSVRIRAARFFLPIVCADRPLPSWQVRREATMPLYHRRYRICEQTDSR